MTPRHAIHVVFAVISIALLSGCASPVLHTTALPVEPARAVKLADGISISSDVEKSSRTQEAFRPAREYVSTNAIMVLPPPAPVQNWEIFWEYSSAWNSLVTWNLYGTPDVIQPLVLLTNVPGDHRVIPWTTRSPQYFFTVLPEWHI